MVGFIDDGGLGMATIHEENTDHLSETASHSGLRASWLRTDTRSATGDSEVGTAQADIFEDQPEQRVPTRVVPQASDPPRRTDPGPKQWCTNINWKIWTLLGILVLAALGGIFWIVFAVSAKQAPALSSPGDAPSLSPAIISPTDDFLPTDSPSSPSMSPSVTMTKDLKDLQELQTFLAANVSIAVLDESTTFYQTWNWFAYDDTAQMRVGVDDDWRIIQRFLIAHLFFSLDGGNWSIDDFLTGKPECNWTGVGCDNATVTGINMNHAQLAGSLPSELVLLSDMQWLVFSNNSLSGSIPEAWWNFENLKLLNLSANEITGQLSPRLWELPSLLYLYVDDNLLTGAIPEVSNDSSPLKLLKADDNQLNGTLPASLWNLRNLTQLFFKYNKLTGELPIVPEGRSIALQALLLDHNEMQGSLPPCTGMDSLDLVHLHGNYFSSQIPECWFQLPKVTYLDLSENNFSGTIPTILNTSLIKYLYLNNNSLSGPLPEKLPPNIKHAWFQNNDLSGTIPQDFGVDCPQLKKLRIQENNVSGSLPSEICDLQNLTLLEADCLETDASVVMCDCCDKCY